MSYTAPTSGSCIAQGLEVKATGAADTSSTSLAVGTGTKSFTIPGASVCALGDLVRAYRVSAPATWMQGTVTSRSVSTNTTLVVTVTTTNGSGTATDWQFEIIERPYRIGYKLAWTIHSDGTEHYEIQYSGDGGSTWSSSIVSSGVVSGWTLHGLPILDSLHSYDFRVRATGGGSGTTSWLTITGPGVFLGENPPSVGALYTPDFTAAATGPTSLQIEITDWSPESTVNIETLCHSHWLVRLKRNGFAAEDYVFAWDRLSIGIENLSPGELYTVQMAAAFIDREDGTIHTTFGPATPVEVETDPADPPVLGPSSITAYTGSLVAGTFIYQGGGQVHAWTIAGIENLLIVPRAGNPNIADLSLDSEPIDTENPEAGRRNKTVAPGVYLATILAAAITDASLSLTQNLFLCRIIVEGGYLIGWLNDDPARLDLQVLLRDRSVAGSALTGGTLKLIQGSALKIFVVFRDGPYNESNFGPVTELAGLSELRLALRPNPDPDGVLLLDIGGTVTTETVNGHDVPVLEFDVESDALTELLEAAGRVGNVPAASVAVACQLSWVWDDGAAVSLTFPGEITEPIRRSS